MARLEAHPTLHQTLPMQLRQKRASSDTRSDAGPLHAWDDPSLTCKPVCLGAAAVRWYAAVPLAGHGCGGGEEGGEEGDERAHLQRGVSGGKGQAGKLGIGRGQARCSTDSVDARSKLRVRVWIS